MSNKFAEIEFQTELEDCKLYKLSAEVYYNPSEGSYTFEFYSAAVLTEDYTGFQYWDDGFMPCDLDQDEIIEAAMEYIEKNDHEITWEDE